MILLRRGSAMDAKAKRKVIAECLTKLRADMDMGIGQMPDDWDETELGWYLVHRARLLTRTSSCLRRRAYEHPLRSRRL
jgi:hypothetical protein